MIPTKSETLLSTDSLDGLWLKKFAFYYDDYIQMMRKIISRLVNVKKFNRICNN